MENKDNEKDKVKQIRAEIDEIDKRLTACLVERFEKIVSLAGVKKELGVPAYCPEREREIMKSILGSIEDEFIRKKVKQSYERIIDESRALHKQIAK